MLFSMDLGLFKYFLLRLTTDDVTTIGTRIHLVAVDHICHLYCFVRPRQWIE